MTQIVIFFNLFGLILVLGALFWFSRVDSRNLNLAFATQIIILGAVTLIGAFVNKIDGFGKIQLLAWAVFVHYPLFLIGVASISLSRKRELSYFSVFVAMLIILVGIDAFFIEPRWIEVSERTIPSEKIEETIRVAVVADIQTDKPGRYEEEVFELIKATEPDLILLAGDYLHFLKRSPEYFQAKTTLNEIMLHSQTEAPLGIYAVRGNVDRGDWIELFEGLEIELFEDTSTKVLDAIVITGLTLNDSANPDLSISAEEKYHIVLGHMPDYSLGQVNADLLIAGHTHGGQVQIPFFGAILTLSGVPREWASGITEIEAGKYLVVSRGVGLERGNAPRMRFFCRPELVIIDLVPME